MFRCLALNFVIAYLFNFDAEILVNCTEKDVVYVLDTSGSLSQSDFDTAVDFLHDVTSFLTIGTSDILVALVTFSNVSVEQFDFDEYTDSSTLLSQINNLKATISPSGGTKTYNALDYVRNSLLTSSKGKRSSAPTAVVVLTDGMSDHLLNTEAAADNLRNVSQDIEIFSVGVGNELQTQQTDLQNIANDPDSYYLHYMQEFVYLCNIVPELVPKIDSTVLASLPAGCIEYTTTTFVWKGKVTTTTTTTASPTTILTTSSTTEVTTLSTTSTTSATTTETTTETTADSTTQETTQISTTLDSSSTESTPSSAQSPVNTTTDKLLNAAGSSSEDTVIIAVTTTSLLITLISVVIVIAVCCYLGGRKRRRVTTEKDIENIDDSSTVFPSEGSSPIKSKKVFLS